MRLRRPNTFYWTAFLEPGPPSIIARDVLVEFGLGSRQSVTLTSSIDTATVNVIERTYPKVESNASLLSSSWHYNRLPVDVGQDHAIAAISRVLRNENYSLPEVGPLLFFFFFFFFFKLGVSKERRYM